MLKLIVLIGLTGCGTGASTVGPGGFTPIRPDPTSTPTRQTSGGAPTAAPTSVVPAQIPIAGYTHPDRRFSIDYPANWQSFERPDGVVFIDPSDQAGYSVVFKDVGQIYSEAELNQYLVTFVAENFIDEDSGFSAISQETQADGSIVAQFSSVDPNLGQAINEIRVVQQDTMVFLIMISVTEEQWQISRPKLQGLADTFTPLDTGPSAPVTPTGEPSWVLIGSTNNQFGFLYPSNWVIQEQQADTVRVRMKDHDLTFEGGVAEWPQANQDAQASAAQAAQAIIDEFAAAYGEVESRPPAEFPLDKLNGVTIDFLYTNQDGTAMAGAVITAASGDKVYRTVFTAPAELYEVALQWFNPMYKSFRVLPSDQIVFPEK
ncbi:MAG: hypothetical protein AB1801_14640 [Chloroflexota bacterium]